MVVVRGIARFCCRRRSSRRRRRRRRRRLERCYYCGGGGLFHRAVDVHRLGAVPCNDVVQNNIHLLAYRDELFFEL